MTSLKMALGPRWENQHSHHFFAPIVLVPFFYPMRPSVIAKGPSCTGTRECATRWLPSLHRREKCDESEVNGCVLDAFRVELSLISCKFQVFNNFFGFRKIFFLKTRVNLLVVYSNKMHMHDTLVHMHGL